MNEMQQLPGTGIRVLIADDTQNIVSMLSSVLELRGFEVLTARNGREALAILERERPHVALLDIVMPGMDGLSLCKRIKGSPETAATVVIIITSITQDSDIPDGLWRTGTSADDFLTKPFDPFDLADRVERLCAERGIAGEPKPES